MCFVGAFYPDKQGLADSGHASNNAAFYIILLSVFDRFTADLHDPDHAFFAVRALRLKHKAGTKFSEQFPQTLSGAIWLGDETRNSRNSLC